MKKLLPKHLEDLHKSALSNEAIAERGYYSATKVEELRKLGFAPYQALAPALVIPHYNHEKKLTHYQIKPDKPRIDRNRDKPKPIKYESPTGSHPMIDISPLCHDLVMEPDSHLFITEGIKKADALASRGFAVLALSGVWNWLCKVSEESTPLPDFDHIPIAGRQVTVLFDSDGRNNNSVKLAGNRLVEYLNSKGAIATLKFVPSRSEGSKTGVDDFLMAGGTVEELLNAPEEMPQTEKPTKFSPQDVHRLMKDLLQAHKVQLWRDPRKIAYVTYTDESGVRSFPVGSDQFVRLATFLIFQDHGIALTKKLAEEVSNQLQAQISFGSAYETYEIKHRWHVELVDGEIGSLWINLCDPLGRVIQVCPMHSDGTRSVNVCSWQECPIRFRHSDEQLPLAEPDFSQTDECWSKYVNIEKIDECLIMGFLVGAFCPLGTLPILSISGPEGSAKSTTVKRMRSVIDPSRSPMRPKPKMKDLGAAAANGAMLVIDNVSNLSGEESDALCQLSTGTSFQERTLYTNTEETTVSARVPIILNGIGSPGDRQDLLSRLIPIQVPRIQNNRRSESELDREWQQACPKLLGQLLTRLSRSLRDFATIDVDTTSRLADNIAWVAASEPESERGTYQRHLEALQHEEKREVLESDTIFLGLKELLTTRSGIVASASEIANLLSDTAVVGRSPYRSAKANAIGKELVRLSVACSAIGWIFEQHRSNKHGRRWVISDSLIDQVQIDKLLGKSTDTSTPAPTLEEPYDPFSDE